MSERAFSELSVCEQLVLDLVYVHERERGGALSQRAVVQALFCLNAADVRRACRQLVAGALLEEGASQSGYRADGRVPELLAQARKCLTAGEVFQALVEAALEVGPPSPYVWFEQIDARFPDDASAQAALASLVSEDLIFDATRSLAARSYGICDPEQAADVCALLDGVWAYALAHPEWEMNIFGVKLLELDREPRGRLSLLAG